MTLPASGRVAVFDRPNGPFRIAAYPLRPPATGEVLVRVAMSTICRSDIHSYQGHRPSPCPGLLGHEIIGRIEALGPGIERDMRGALLAPGDRITWSEYFVPGPHYLGDALELPQKTPGAHKYGHLCADTQPHHHGGFADYCYVLPRSWILRLPDELSDEEATPINCGVATMIAATEAANLRIGDTVVVQGLGLLGLYAAAIARARGANRVIGLDAQAARRARAADFGVDLACDPAAPDALERVRAACPALGADAVLEVCGDAAVIPAGLDLLRIGGSYVLAGVVNPSSMVSLDASLVLRKCLTLRGVHNYHPRHLAQALDFVVAHRRHYPFHALVDARYPLERVDAAMDDAAGRRVLRAAIVP